METQPVAGPTPTVFAKRRRSPQVEPRDPRVLEGLHSAYTERASNGQHTHLLLVPTEVLCKLLLYTFKMLSL